MEREFLFISTDREQGKAVCVLYAVSERVMTKPVLWRWTGGKKAPNPSDRRGDGDKVSGHESVHLELSRELRRERD
jgi:hypothetical protein